MHDHVAEVDQDPAAVGVAFGARDLASVVACALRNRVGDGTRLDDRAPGDDDECVGDDGPPIEVEDGDVFALFVFGGGADEFDEIRQGISPGSDRC
jgi:hypothetical protein